MNLCSVFTFCFFNTVQEDLILSGTCFNLMTLFLLECSASSPNGWPIWLEKYHNPQSITVTKIHTTVQHPESGEQWYLLEVTDVIQPARFVPWMVLVLWGLLHWGHFGVMWHFDMNVSVQLVASLTLLPSISTIALGTNNVLSCFILYLLS